MGQILTGAEILLESLIAEGVDTIFGYPGGQILSVYDKLYSYTDRLNHILVRHEQGAVHAAQGYARASSRPGVVMVTSGPGATNVITGIADAMIDSTPIVVIAGQVGTAQLGTDAFQETDLVGMTAPISKWVYQIKEASEVAEAVAKAFHIATTGRPGPVVLDFTKTAQVGSAEYKFSKCDFIRSYVPVPTPDSAAIDEAVRLIDEAERPLVIFGQGIILSHAEEQLKAFLKKGGIPATSTLLGLSALPSDFPYYIGMAGMHGNVAPNMMTQRCDLLIAVGNKVIHVDVGINGDARQVLAAITERMRFSFHDDWTFSARNYERVEDEKVVAPEVRPESGSINMGEVVAKVAEASLSGAIVVTDVGQNQMTAARYSRFVNSRSFISSGGLGTMGFGLPAAIGAKIGAPGRNVVLFVGDGGLQMTVQEFGTIMQEHVAVKIVMLNNNWLGNVRQWQELFFGERYSQTRMLNPEYCLIARAYGIRYRMVEDREFLDEAVREMLDSKEPYLLDVHVNGNEMVYPMIPPGKRVDEIMLNKDEWYHDAE